MKVETVYLILNSPTLLWVVLKVGTPGSLSLLGASFFVRKSLLQANCKVT
jgi:hypothetical protein